MFFVSVVFEAVYGNIMDATTIAIDDVSFSDGCTWNQYAQPGEIPTTTPPSEECDAGYYPCNGGGCYEASQRCDFFDACKDSSYPVASTDESTCGNYY